MIGMTYDPAVDASYFYLGSGPVASTEEAGPFLYDLDAERRVVGIEILGASLAPGPWQNARFPGSPKADAAE